MACAVCVLALPAAAAADHATRPHTKNIHAKGHSPHLATFFGEPDGVRHISSDLAFRGSLAFQGNYDGFRIVDIRRLPVVNGDCRSPGGDDRMRAARPSAGG